MTMPMVLLLLGLALIFGPVFLVFAGMAFGFWMLGLIVAGIWGVLTFIFGDGGLAAVMAAGAGIALGWWWRGRSAS